MKVALLGNDLRTLALGNRLCREGCTVVLVPGTIGSPCGETVSLYPLPQKDGPPWWQMMRADELVATVAAIAPDLAVVMHVESSISEVTERLRALAGRSRKGLQVLGVDGIGARLESSKIEGIQVARSAGLAVPQTQFVPTGQRDALVQSPFGYPCVLKADGLAGGRGTVIVEHPNQFVPELQRLPVGDVVIQEFVRGHEVAVSLWVAGGTLRVLNINFEYKRAYEGDLGPNTPGMGTVAYCGDFGAIPTILLADLARVLQAHRYVGPLDVNFMVRDGKPVFLEFTTRFGDPELMSELLLLNDVTTMLGQAAQNRMHVLTRPAPTWAASILGRGSAALMVLDGDQQSLYSMEDEAGTVWCSSSAARSLEAAIVRTYEPFRAATGLSLRRDIGHDVRARASAIAGWWPNVSESIIPDVSGKARQP